MRLTFTRLQVFVYKIPPRQSARGYRLTLMGNGNGNVLAMENLFVGEKDENYEF